MNINFCGFGKKQSKWFLEFVVLRFSERTSMEVSFSLGPKYGALAYPQKPQNLVPHEQWYFHSMYIIVKDSKCGYPSACNSLETVLINKDLVKTNFFEVLCDVLRQEGVSSVLMHHNFVQVHTWNSLFPISLIHTRMSILSWYWLE